MDRRYPRLLTKRRIAALLVLLGMSAALGARAASSPSSPPSPPASPSALAAPTSIYDFEETGITDFPNVYTGGVHEPDGSVTFSVTRRDPALLAAIAAADTAGTPYRFVRVPYSYAETNAVIRGIAKHGTALTADGVRLVAWESDPRTSMVVVHLATPTDADRAELAAVMHVPRSSVTVASYPGQVQALLRAQFGNGVQVDPTYGEPAIAD